jgi:UDP:flavonoid glycosyltransferase YjiC (YdhE family)
MRVLFTAHGAYGHVLPLVPTARALQRAGHEVRFAVADDIHPVLRSLALEAHAAGLGDTALVAEAHRRWPETLREPPARWAVKMFTDIAAPAMSRDLSAVIDAWRPDLIVREEGEYGAPMAAAIADLPWITHGWGSPLASTADRARVAELLRPHWLAAGVRPHDGEELLGTGVIAPCPPSLSPLPTSPRTRSIRPEMVELRSAEEPIDPGDDQLVYVGFGTVPLYRDDPCLLTMLVRSVLATGFQVLVTTSHANIAAALRAIDRTRVQVRRWVSLPHVLPMSRLVVSHGGAGTVLAALTAATPLLLLPRGAPSQTRMATVCARRGVARTLDSHDVSAAGVEAALVDLITDDRFRQNVRRVACEIAKMPEADTAIPWLEHAAKRP